MSFELDYCTVSDLIFISCVYKLFDFYVSLLLPFSNNQPKIYPMNLKTHYMGIEIKNPIIIGSSGLTVNLSNLRRMEDNGAGAVVLKSVYEEQILLESGYFPKPGRETIYNNLNTAPDASEYLHTYIKDHTLTDYLKFLSDAKRSIKIPVFASINCYSAGEWLPFVNQIQDTGADGIELNIYIPPADFNSSPGDMEKLYFEVIEAIVSRVNIPVSLKMGHNFPNLSATIKRFSDTGIKGLVLFNKPYSTDIDLNTLTVTYPGLFTLPGEFAYPLRWGSLLSGKLGCGMIASTGVHHFEAILKLLLAGFDGVQTASVFYKNDYSIIREMIERIERWMTTKRFECIADFKGKLSHPNPESMEIDERIEYIRLFTRYQIV